MLTFFMESKDTIMLQQELRALREQLTRLESEVAEVKARATFDRENMFKFIEDRLREVEVYIFGSFNKLFPDYAKSAEEFEKLIGWKPGNAMHSYGKAKDGKEIL